MNIKLFRQQIIDSKKEFHTVLLYENKHTHVVYDPDDNTNELHNLYSVTKSLISVLVIKALKERGISLESRLKDIRELENIAFNDYISGLKIYEILNMTTGIEWDEFTNFSKPDNDFSKFLKSKNKIEFYNSLSLTEKVFNYNSSVSHLLSIILFYIKQKKPLNYAKEILFDEIGITKYKWEEDHEGINYGGYGLYLTPSDLMSIGKRLLYDTELREVFDTIIKSSKSRYMQYEYGMQFWSGRINGKVFYGAYGHKGQRLLIFPKEEIIIVFTGNVSPEFGIHEKILKQIM